MKDEEDNRRVMTWEDVGKFAIGGCLLGVALALIEIELGLPHCTLTIVGIGFALWCCHKYAATNFKPAEEE
jgi:hypothetical protein